MPPNFVDIYLQGMRDRSMRSGTELAREIKLTDWSMTGNLSNRSSGVPIPRDICTRLKRYLYSAKCSWIIKANIWKFLYLNCERKIYIQDSTAETQWNATDPLQLKILQEDRGSEGTEILEHDFPVHVKSFPTYSVIHNHSLLQGNLKIYFASCRNANLLMNEWIILLMVYTWKILSLRNGSSEKEFQSFTDSLKILI